jgi:hypothetical protein
VASAPDDLFCTAHYTPPNKKDNKIFNVNI